MEGLFNLLLESPLLLFFIIAAILSFIQGRGRGAEEENKGPRRPQQQRDQSPPEPARRENEVDWKDIFRQEERPTQPQPTVTRGGENQREAERRVSSLPRDAEQELSKSNRELHERYEKIQSRKKRASEQAGKIDNSPIFEGDLTRRKEKVRLDFSNVSREEAVKGVIWSEILGKPKARRK
ncbi:hypothetical protein [Salipaludibacillus aurantiacus]|uniref:Uncharacterized protein n=1 Tax=Salipaludibacillus aurantiacus TaxID=1601833 RepID=A0A1H9RF11_9BACI|nr:hypothetical protein [Salipaludibacillus aurantiacus]SER70559.1 hypothetical protein SAMN05518684_10390 [Salipaludibacillus aurantiacus]